MEETNESSLSSVLHTSSFMQACMHVAAQEGSFPQGPTVKLDREISYDNVDPSNNVSTIEYVRAQLMVNANNRAAKLAGRTLKADLVELDEIHGIQQSDSSPWIPTNSMFTKPVGSPIHVDLK